MLVQKDPSPKKHRLAIFASGAGTNAQKIIQHFSDHPFIEVGLVVSNKPGAGVLEIARRHGISTLVIEKEPFYKEDGYVETLHRFHITFIILAGFLWKVPGALIKAYPNQIINIHPALLPKFGGKGMYGNHVHEAVLLNQESISGITIHWVDELYDHGSILFQTHCMVLPTDTPQTLAERIHRLEHAHYPIVIENLLMGRGQVSSNSV